MLLRLVGRQDQVTLDVAVPPTRGAVGAVGLDLFVGSNAIPIALIILCVTAADSRATR